MNDKILIRNLIVPARIGIYDAEKKAPQRIRINCTLELLPKSRAGVDDIADTVSYETIRKAIVDHLQAGHIHLLETAAENIADICLRDKRVATAQIGVEKLDIFDDCESVGVEISRGRNI